MPTATLELNVKATLVLDDTDYSIEQTYLLGLVTAADKRNVTVSNSSQINILNVASGAGAGQLTGLDFLCIVNTDTTNFCRIRVSKLSGQTFDIKLMPGQVWFLYNRKLSANTSAAAFTAFVDLDAIYAQFDTAPGTLKLLAAQL